MSLKPDYLIRVGSSELTPASAQALSGLEIECAKNRGASIAMLDFGGSASPLKLDDRVAIELGWFGQQRSAVFTGVVGGIGPTLAGIRISAFGEEMKLIKAGRISATFENQTHGDIVKAHAAEVGVATVSIEDGYRTPLQYAHNRTRYEHCLALASSLGFDLYANGAGKLVFVRFARRKADHVLRAGRDLHNLTMRRTHSRRGVTVVPESPASSAGDETAPWLVKDALAHAATEGDGGVLVVSAPSLRTRDAAKQAAQARMASAARTEWIATATLAGRADIQLGHAVELKEVEHADANGVYEVRGVKHILGRSRGFSTALNLGRLAQ